MKKILIPLLAVLMVFSLSACGVGGTKTETSSSSQGGQVSSPSSTDSGKSSSATGELLSAGYANIMKSGKFLIHYQATITEEGVAMDADITTAADGETVATVMKAQKLTNHSIIKDHAVYVLDDESKTYYKMDIPGGSENNGSFTDTQGLTYVGKGTGTVSGKTLPYEEYKAGEETLRFFMDGKKLFAITSKTADSESVMVILELTNKIPDGFLSIPADYKEGMSVPDLSSIDLTGGQQEEAGEE